MMYVPGSVGGGREFHQELMARAQWATILGVTNIYHEYHYLEFC